jgi:DNA-binding MarR family transcriptional regulator
MDITTSLGFRLAKVLRLKRNLTDRAMKKLDLSRTQWRVLLWMTALGSCTQKDLLNQMDIDPGHLARVLDEFEKNKIILRSPLKEDRRVLFIKITTKGKKKYIPDLKKVLKEENAILVNGLTLDEQNKLSKALEKIENNIELALKNKTREPFDEQ